MKMLLDRELRLIGVQSLVWSMFAFVERFARFNGNVLESSNTVVVSKHTKEGRTCTTCSYVTGRVC